MNACRSYAFHIGNCKHHQRAQPAVNFHPAEAAHLLVKAVLILVEYSVKNAAAQFFASFHAVHSYAVIFSAFPVAECQDAAFSPGTVQADAILGKFGAALRVIHFQCIVFRADCIFNAQSVKTKIASISSFPGPDRLPQTRFLHFLCFHRSSSGDNSLISRFPEGSFPYPAFAVAHARDARALLHPQGRWFCG